VGKARPLEGALIRRESSASLTSKVCVL
jgi:hypothetical protein